MVLEKDSKLIVKRQLLALPSAIFLLYNNKKFVINTVNQDEL